MAQQPVYQLLELPTFAEDTELQQKQDHGRTQRRARGSDDSVQASLVAQLHTESPAQLSAQLAQLYEQSPQLYEQAMTGLQRYAGNQAVTQLHAEVMQCRLSAGSSAEDLPAQRMEAAPAQASGAPVAQLGPNNSYSAGEGLKWGDGTAFEEDRHKAQWDNCVSKGTSAALDFVELTTGWKPPNADDVLKALEKQAQIAFDAEVELRKLEIGHFQSEVDYLDGLDPWYGANTRTPYQETKFHENKTRLAAAEADLKKLENERSSSIARLAKDAAKVVGDVSSMISKVSGAGASAGALSKKWHPGKFNNIGDAADKIGRLASALKFAANILDHTALNNFQKNPTRETAEAWASHVGATMSSLAGLVPSLPGGWDTVIKGLLQMPSIVIGNFINTSSEYFRRVHEETTDRECGNSEMLPEGGSSSGQNKCVQPKLDPAQLMPGPIGDVSGSDSPRELPGEVQAKMEAAFAADFSDVQVFEGPQAPAIGALAYAQGHELHFAPGQYDPGSQSGQELLGHELTHVVQQRAGRVQPGRNVGAGMAINSDPGLEKEADTMGAKAARGQSASVSGASAGGSKKEAGGAQAAQRVGAMPDKLKFKIAGQLITVKAPNTGGKKKAIVSINKEVVPGLTLGRATVYFKEDWTFDKGKVTAKLKVGNYVNADNVSLTLGKTSAENTFSVSASIKGAALTVGSLLSGTIDCTVGTDGITGKATIQFNKITIGHTLKLTKGTVALTMDSTGAIKGSGTLEATYPNIGKVVFKGTVDNEKLGGSLTVTLDKGLKVLEHVTLQGGSIEGTYQDDALTLAGQLDFKVRDWAQASIKGTWTSKDKKWKADGTIKQIKTATMGDLTISNGELGITMANSAFTKVTAKADYTMPNYKGSVSGEYDVPKNHFKGKGNVELVTAHNIPKTKVKIKALKGTCEVAENLPTKMTGSATIEIPYQEKPTFEVTISDLTYMVKEGKASGTGSVKTLRDITLGDTAKFNATILVGATAQGKIKDNNIEAISSGIAFKVNEATKPFGTGTISLTFDANGKVKGDGSFTLDAAYKVPDKKEGPVTINQGAKVTIKLADSAFTEIGIANVGFVIENFAKDDKNEKCGKIEGSIRTGKIDLANNNAVDVDGSAKVTGGWSFGATAGKLSFKEGGSVELAMKASKITKMGVKIPFGVQFAGAKAVKMSGDIDGTIDPLTQKVGGTITISPDENVDFKVGTDFVELVKEGTKVTATFSNNNLDSLTGSTHIKYYLATKSEAGLLLEGTLTSATYHAKDQAVSVKGGLTLKRKIEKQTLTGSWKLIVNKGATVDVDVKKNQLDKLEGNIAFEVHDETSKLLDGTLKSAAITKNGEEISGTVDLKLARNVFFPKREKETQQEDAEAGITLQIIEGTWVKGEVKKSKLATLSAGLNFAVRKDKSPIAKGEVKGDYNFTNDKFTGDGKVALTGDYSLKKGASEFKGSGKATDPDLRGWDLALKQGSSVGLKVEENNLRKAKIDVGLKCTKGKDKIAEGKVTGDYLFGHKKGFTGNFEAGLCMHLPLGQLGTKRVFKFVLDKSTKFSGETLESSLKSAKGQFAISVLEGSDTAVTIKTAAGVEYNFASGIAGSGSLEVTKDLFLVDLDPYGFTMLKGSGGKGTLMENQIDTFIGKLSLMLQKDKKDLAKGDFEFSGTSRYSLRGENSQLAKDLKAKVELVRDIKVTEKPVKGFTATLLKKAGLNLHMKNNVLNTLGGAISLDFDHEKVAKFAKLELNGTYTAPDGGKFDGTGKITVNKDLELFKSKTGYAVTLEKGAAVQVDIADSNLKTIGAGVSFLLIKDGKKMVRLKLSGNYTHVPEPNFDGSADAELLEPIVMTKTQLGGTVGVTIHRGVGFTAKIANSDLDSLEAKNIKVDVDDGTKAFAQVTCTQAKYAKAGGSPKVTVKGDIKITNTQKIWYEGNSGKINYKVKLRDGSGMNIDVTDNKFVNVGGTVLGTLEVNNEPFIEVDVKGSYSDEKKLDGTGKARMKKGYKIADVAGGKYSIWIESGGAKATQMDVTVTGGKLMSVGGTIYGALKTGANETSPNLVEGNITGSYDVAGSNGLTANGSMKVVKSTAIGKPIAGYTLILSDKSKATVDFQASDLKSFGGNIVVVVQDAKGDLLEVGFDGNFDVKTAELTGKGGIKVLNPRTLFKYKDKFEFKLMSAGSEAKVDIQKNDLKSINGAANFEVDLGFPGVQNPFAKASVTGDWVRGADSKEGGKFTGSASLTTVSDLDLTALQGTKASKGDSKKWIEDWSIIIGAGSSIGLTLKGNAPEQTGAQITLNAKAKQNGEDKATGQLKGEYLLGDAAGFTGGANLKVISPIKLGQLSLLGRNFTFAVQPETSFDAKTEKSSLVSANGKFVLLVSEDNEKIKVTLNGNYEKGKGISSTGKAEVLNDLLIAKVGTNDSLWLKQKSGGDFKVEANDLKTVGGTVLLRYDREGKEFANGDLKVDVDMSKASPKVTGKGTVNLVDKYVVTKEGIKGYYAVLRSGSVELSLVNSEMDYIDGKLQASIDKPLDTQIIAIDVKGRYTAGSKPSLDVDGTAKVVGTTDVYTTQSGFVVQLLSPADGIKVVVAKSELKELGAGVVLRLDRPKDKGLVKLSMKGKYTHSPEPDFNGTATADLLDTLEVNQTIGDADYKFALKSGASLTAEVANKDLKRIEGSNFKVGVSDESAEFLEVSVKKGKYLKEGKDAKVSVQGGVKVTNPNKCFYTHNAGQVKYELFLRDGTGMNIDVADSKLKKIDGKIAALIKRGGKDFVSIDLDGSYTKADSFTGKAKAKLLDPYKVGKLGKFELWLESEGGTEFELHMAKGELTKIGGSISVSVRQGDEVLFKGGINDTNYEFGKPTSFAGKGSLLTPKTVKLGAPVKGYQLKIGGGSNVKANFAGGEAQEIKGDIQVLVDDGKGDFLKLGFEGNFDVTTAQLSGSCGFEVLDSRKLFGYQDFEFWISSTGSKAKVELTKNELVKAGGSLTFMAKYKGADLAKAELKGDWIKEGNKYTGSAKLTLVNDFDLKPPAKVSGAAKWIEGWALSLAQGSTLEFQVSNSEPDQGGSVSCNLKAVVKKDGTAKATGTLTGKYVLGSKDGFSGDADLVVNSEIVLGEVKGFELSISPETKFSAKANKSALESANGTFKLVAKQGGTAKLDLTVTGDYLKGSGVTAEAKLNVLDDLKVFESGEHSVFIKQGSGGKVTVAKNDLTGIGGTILLRYDYNKKELVNGSFELNLALKKDANQEVTAKGKVDVVGTADLTPQGIGGYHFWIKPAQGIDFSLTKSKLDYVSGKVVVGVHDDQGEFLEATLEGKYDAKPKAFDGKGQLKVTAARQIAEYQIYKLFVEPCEGLTVEVTQEGLKKISGKIKVRIDDDQNQLLRLTLDGAYNGGKNAEFSGKADATVLNTIAAAEMVGKDNYTFNIMAGGSQITVELAKNELKEAHGKIKVEVWDTEGKFVEVDGQLDYVSKGESGEVSANGKLAVVRAKQVAEKAPWTVFLEAGSGGEIGFDKNELKKLKGVVKLLVKKDANDFAKVDLDITYAEGKVSGEGKASIEAQFKAGAIGNKYELWVDPGTGANIKLADNELTYIGGKVNLRLVEGGSDFIKGHLEVQYDTKKPKLIKAEGGAEVCNDHKLVGGDQKGGWSIWALKCGGFNVLFENDNLSHIKGDIKVRVDDPTGPLVEIGLNGTFDAKGGTGFTGDGEVKVVGERKVLTVAKTYDIYLTAAGSGAKAWVKKNALTEVDGKVAWRVDEGGSGFAEGELTGNWKVGPPSLWTAKGSVKLLRDVQLPPKTAGGTEGKLESWSAWLNKDSSLEMNIKNGAPQSVTVDVGAKLKRGNEDAAEGSIKGKYNFGDDSGYTGKASFEILNSISMVKVGKWNMLLGKGTNFDANLTKSRITKAKGKFVLIAEEEGTDKIKLTLDGKTYTPDKGLSGSGKIEVLAPIRIYKGEGNGLTLWMDKGSGATGTIKNNKITKVKGQVNLRLDKGESPFAKGEFKVNYAMDEGDKSMVTADGKVELIGDYEIPGISGENYKFVLEGGSSIGAGIKNSDLNYVDGQLKVRIEDKDGKFGQLDVKGRYQHLGTKDLTLDGSAEITRRYDVGVNVLGYDIKLGAGTGAKISIKKMKLVTISAKVAVCFDKGSDTYVYVELSGTYNHQKKLFNGTGSAKVLKLIEVAKDVTKWKLSLYLLSGSGLSAEVADNKLKKVDGQLEAEVHDEKGKFLHVSGKCTYTKESEAKGSLDATASVEVTRQKEMGTFGGYKFEVMPGTGAKMVMTKNDIDSISASLNVKVSNNKGLEAEIMLKGDPIYSKDGGYNASGKARLLKKYQVAAFGKYVAYLEPTESPTAEITIVNGEVTHVGASVKVLVTDKTSGKEIDFMRGSVTADYKVKEGIFSGTGEVSVLNDKKLATIKAANFNDDLFLCKGSGVTVVIENNDLKKVSGNIRLRMDDVKTQQTFIKVQLQGSFDAVANEFTGTGGAEVVTRRQLLKIGDYAFWLGEGGAGFKVSILKNDLEYAKGWMNLEIHDKEGCLVKGKADGTYTPADGFSGSGELYLARDKTFEKAGVKIVVKEGSGGKATVKKNDLESLGGTLKAEVWARKKAGAYTIGVYVEASGEYNVKEGKLVEASGMAKLLKPVEILKTKSGTIMVNKLEGSARFKNNELVEASGKAEIAAKFTKFEATGFLQAKWRTEGGKDYFSGRGRVTFKVEQPKIWGEVDIQYNEDKTFKIYGEVNYEMNEFLSGKIGIEVDEKLDPCLSGEMRVNNVTLMKGRPLFSKDMRVLKWGTTIMAGFVPIAIGVGCDFGFQVLLKPVVFSAKIGFSDFYPLRMNVPTFNARADLTTGLSLRLALMPYAQLGIGITGVSAGVRLKGLVALNCDVDINPYLEFWGDSKKFGGELGLNLSIKPSVELGVAAQLYAEFLGAEVTYDIFEFKEKFDDLFSWDWNAAFQFGDDPPKRAKAKGAPSGKLGGAAKAEKKLASDGKGGEGVGFDKPSEPDQPFERGPKVPKADDIDKKETKDPKKGGGPMDKLKKKMADIQEWMEHIGNLAHLIGFVVSVMSVFALFAWLGPFGLLIALAWALLVSPGKPGKLVDAITKSIPWLLKKLGNWIWENVLPEWIKDVIDILKKGLVYAADKLYEWGEENIHSFWWPAVEPMFKWVKKMAKKLTSAFKSLDGSIGGIIMALIKLLLAGISGLKDLVGAIKDMWDEFVKCIQKLCYAGQIRAVDTNTNDSFKDPWLWEVNLPGIDHWGPHHSDDTDDWLIGNLIDDFLRGPFDCKRSDNDGDWDGGRRGFDYAKKSVSGGSGKKGPKFSAPSKFSAD